MDTTNKNKDIIMDLTGGVFETRKTPLHNSHLEIFEQEFWNMIKNLKFTKHTFCGTVSIKGGLKKLTYELKNINVDLDETRNLYNIDIDLNDELMHREITKTKQEKQNSS